MLKPILEKYWGYSEFRPLQEDAMNSVLSRRDSLVVMPTGGGKSLCFQAPALAMDGMAVVVSPLISLMKDQVDYLKACGVGADCIHSGLMESEKRPIDQRIRSGDTKVLYVAPERLTTSAFQAYLKRFPISFFAIDEAHCISHWGHDFRPHYRQLRELKSAFDNIPIHAYTATATQPVRKDICVQLGLSNPDIYVGDFDRPNLMYSVVPKTDEFEQVLSVIKRYDGESGIVYCISRKKVDEMAMLLASAGHRALPYHAGMDDQSRRRNQDAFSRDEAKIIVATVAFGMGIDKSNVRYVVHAGMPKSLEHYQQEAGRAGRDGLPAECVLIFSNGDRVVWQRMLRDLEGEAHAAAMTKLDDMFNYCMQRICRHKRLVEYFGQPFTQSNCGGCDCCLGVVEVHEDSQSIGRLIIQCVNELRDYAGPTYTSLVLSGSNEERIHGKGHNTLPSWGTLSKYRQSDVRDWIEQLVAQEFLVKQGEFNVLSTTDKAQSMLTGETLPRLSKPATAQSRKGSKQPRKTWEGVDRGLVEALRERRLALAQERSVAAFIIFGDTTLRDLALKQPKNRADLLRVSGIGEKKCDDFGSALIETISNYLEAHPEAAGTRSTNPVVQKTPRINKPDPLEHPIKKEYEAGASMADVMEKFGVTQYKASKLMIEYIADNDICDPTPWVLPEVAAAVTDAVKKVGVERLRPIFEYLEERVDYETIRVVIACLENAGIDDAATTA